MSGSLSFFPSRHPQQRICHLQKSDFSLYDSLINNLHFKKNLAQIGQQIQKLQSFAKKCDFLITVQPRAKRTSATKKAGETGGSSCSKLKEYISKI
jgi:hypothetical protein